MFSPYTLAPTTDNSKLIAENQELATRLAKFFQDEKFKFLWDINTARQRMTKALEHTSMIALRRAVAPGDKQITNTLEWNQVTDIIDTQVLEKFPIFQDLVKWLEESLKSTGAENVEFGRIFFSKHLANTQIGLHTDEGAYFDYYDRFHFVIDQTDGENIFFIREEPILLEVGKLYWVNNHVPHWLENRSSKDRINLIFDARLS